MGKPVGRDVVPGFGDRVRETRERNGWSQAELARRAATHFTTVSKIEQGERSASLQLALRLADALGVPLTKLVPADWKARLSKEAKPAPPARKKPTAGRNARK
jgi:transcriptional regulator with XRE-family HTH domain